MQHKTDIVTYYILGLFLIGLSYIAITPIFEGFDETAHYSSLREIAYNNRIPVYGSSFIDQNIINYKGPKSYSTGAPPFDLGYVYPKFFADSNAVSTAIEN